MTGGPIVAVDSAETSGIAILDRQRLVRHGVVKIADWRDIERVAARLESYAPALVAIEDVYIRHNDHTAIRLATLGGRWEQALERLGLRTIRVLASVWQVSVLPITHRSPRAERKAAAVRLVRERFGCAVSEDAADAICLALYVAGQREAEGITPSERVSAFGRFSANHGGAR